MREINYFQSIKKQSVFIIALTAGAFIIGIVFTLLTPRQYSSSVGLLIVQKETLQTDPFLADRSIERFSETIAQVIKTSAFFNDVMNAGFAIDDTFGNIEARRREQWKEKIETEVVPKSGLLKITVYDENKNQAEQITQAIAGILSSEKGRNYHGAGESIMIKTVDTPLTSDLPTKPNPIINLITALVVGLFLGVFFSIIADQYQLLNSGPKTELVTQAGGEHAYAPKPATPTQPTPIQSVLPRSPEASVVTFQTNISPRKKHKPITTIFDHVRNLDEANKNLVYGGQTAVDSL